MTEPLEKTFAALQQEAKDLREKEAQLLARLLKVRQDADILIAEFGGMPGPTHPKAPSPRAARPRPPATHPPGVIGAPTRQARRPMSAAARRAISRAQKARWRAKRKADGKD